MAKHFKALCFLFVVVLSSAGGSSAAGQCTDGLGACGTDCDQRCVQKHGQGSQGSCDYTLNPPLCNCYYPCGGPPPKVCNGGVGACIGTCWNDCCNTKCAQKYASGTGFCDNSVSAAALCQCQYPC